MSRTFKDRKGYKTRNRHLSYTSEKIYNVFRGGYEDYDHSDQELYVDDQCCDNCRYFNGGICNKYDREDYEEEPESGWCDEWRGGYAC